MRTTSVPQSPKIDADRLKREVVKLLELGYEAVRLSGDYRYLKEPTKLARGIYEEFFKLEANLGRWDQNYVNKIGRAIERVEAILARRLGNDWAK